MVKVKKGGVETGHVFACKSAAIKKKWMKMIQINIDALNDKKAGPPAPTPRSAATMVRLGQQGPGAPTPTSASVVSRYQGFLYLIDNIYDIIITLLVVYISFCAVFNVIFSLSLFFGCDY